MMGLGWSEMVVIAIVALIVIGPKDLPRVLRQVGRAVATVRRMGNEFRAEFNKVAQMDEVTDIKRSLTQPFRETAEDLKKTNADITSNFNKVTDKGVEPTGVLKPADPKVESVYETIRDSVGLSEGPPTELDPAKAGLAAAAQKSAADGSARATSDVSNLPAQPPVKRAAPKAKAKTAGKPAAEKGGAKTVTAKARTSASAARKPATPAKSAGTAAGTKSTSNGSAQPKSAATKSGKAKSPAAKSPAAKPAATKSGKAGSGSPTAATARKPAAARKTASKGATEPTASEA